MDYKVGVDRLPVMAGGKRRDVPQWRRVLMIEVKCSHHLRVFESGCVERPQVRGMFVAINHDDMPLVHLAYGADATKMEGVEAGHLAREGRIRLVQYFIGHDGGFLAIASGDFMPESGPPLLSVGVVPQKHFAVSALGIPIACLTPGRAVEIQQNPQALTPTPAN